MSGEYLTPEQAREIPLSLRPIKRIGEISSRIISLEEASGIKISGRPRQLMFRSTLVMAAQGVELAAELGADIVHIVNRNSFELINEENNGKNI